MRIPLNRNSPVPLYQQIERFLRDQIRSGLLSPETRLPATRALASALGVSRVTVANAYDDLEAEGLLVSRTGSGTYVSPGLEDLDRARPGTALQDWPLWQQGLLTSTWLPALKELDRLAAAAGPQGIRLGSGMGAADLYPVDDFRRAIQSVLRRDPLEAVGYGDSVGYPPLRTTIARILSSQGVPTSPDEVLVTSGSQQALALIADLLLSPGDVVLVESPTYVGAIDLFRSMGVRLLGIPMDDQGLRIDRLEEAAQAARPRLLYTIPTFHNPTGTCLSGVRRRALISLADRYNIPIVEDDFVGDLRYEGRAQPALRALDPGGRVIYISTFSKMLMPGLRVGFLAASGPVFERLAARKRSVDLTTSNLMQRALEAYITVGRYQAHLRKAARIYHRRRDAMVAALQRYMPEETTWTVPEGGLFLWACLPGGLSSNDLYPLAAREGVTFTPGSFFFPGERAQPFLRLNFAAHPPEAIDEGVRRLGQALRILQKAPPRATPPEASRQSTSI
jgi:GntR family transcriptional regulator/MocR family aminotransferase